MDVERVEGTEEDFEGMWFYIPKKFDGALEEIMTFQQIENMQQHLDYITIDDVLDALEKGPKDIKYLNRFACEFVRKIDDLDLSMWGYYSWNGKQSFRYNVGLNQFMMPKPVDLSDFKG